MILIKSIKKSLGNKRFLNIEIVNVAGHYLFLHPRNYRSAKWS